IDGRGGLQKRPAQALRKVHALALDVGAGFFPELQRLFVVAKDDACLLENDVRILLDQRQAFLVQLFIDVDVALDIGELRAGAAAGARGAARRRSATGSTPASCVRRFLINCRVLAHDRSSSLKTVPAAYAAASCRIVVMHLI